MSEVGWYRTRIRIPRVQAYASNIEESPPFEILRRAVEVAAEGRQGTLSGSVTDAGGRETSCDIAITTPDFPRGVGINIDRSSGAVAFLYDPSGGYRDVAKAITDEITQNYVSVGLIRAMKSLGYRVREESGTGAKAVVLVGEM